MSGPERGAVDGEGMDAVVDSFGCGEVNVKIAGGRDDKLCGEGGSFFSSDPPQL